MYPKGEHPAVDTASAANGGGRNKYIYNYLTGGKM